MRPRSAARTASLLLEARRVDAAMLRAADPPDEAAKPATRVFVCGPTPFVGTVTRLLVDKGYKPRAIGAEDFGTPG
jgi:ferredoxin-NADP reductase